jgi:hypothetical protein
MERFDFTAEAKENCQLFKDGVPIVTSLGHGAAFQEENPDYHGGFVQI